MYLCITKKTLIMTLTKEQIIEVRDASHSVAEMLQKLSLNNYWALKYHCNKYGISLQCFKQKYTIDHNKFMELYNQGLTDPEIGEKLNIHPKAIELYRRKHKISRKGAREIVLTDEQYQVFIGGMYGDSCIVKHKDSYATMHFAHQMKQEKYCLWKGEILKPYVHNPYYTHQYDKRISKTSDQVRIVTENLKFFNDWYDKFYHEVDGKMVKYVNKEVFETIEPLGLAVLFQDDGSRAKSGYMLATCCFSKEDLSIIQKVLLNKFGEYIKTIAYIFLPVVEINS